MVMWSVVAALSLDGVYAGTFEVISILEIGIESIETFLWIQLRADKAVYVVKPIWTFGLMFA